MQFAQTNDLISTRAVSIDPAVGFEFGYIDLAFYVLAWEIFNKLHKLTTQVS